MEKYSRRALWLAILAAVLLLGVMAGGTLAWFTAANQRVSTSTVSGRTGSGELTLELSRTEDFSRPEAEVGIVQINTANTMELMPVSTDDLHSFVYCPITTNGMAANFRPVNGEQFYFHGRVYLRATAQGLDANIGVYLDGSEDVSPLFGQIDGQLLNAARLGLRLGTEEPVILSLSKAGNGLGAAMNTIVNGTRQEEGIVLHSAGSGAVEAVADPSIPFEDCMVTRSAGPKRALFTVMPNTVYPLDIYFYLEGCDPDCTNIISADMASIGLRLYAVAA